MCVCTFLSFSGLSETVVSTSHTLLLIKIKESVSTLTREKIRTLSGRERERSDGFGQGVGKTPKLGFTWVEYGTCFFTDEKNGGPIKQ